MAVVRDDDHGAVALVQDAFEPAYGVDIQVVGRLVEQQDVGIAEQRLREQHAQLPAGRDLAHRAVVLLDRYADAGQEGARARFGRITAELGELVLELRGAHVVVFAGFGVRVNRIAGLHCLPHFGVAHQHDVEHPHVFVRELVLLQLAQALAAVDRDRTRARLEVAAENFHERGLAAAVGADQAIAIAVAEPDRDVFEQRLAAELHGDVGGAEHGEYPMVKLARGAYARAADYDFFVLKAGVRCGASAWISCEKIFGLPATMLPDSI